MEKNKAWKWFVGGCLGTVMIFACLSAIGIGYLLAIMQTAEDEATPLAVILTATPTLRPSTPTPSPTIPPSPEPAPIEEPRPPFVVPPAVIQESVSLQQWRDLETLWGMNPPVYDYYEVARRYGDAVGERTIAGKIGQNGEVRTFWVDEEEISAELALITDNFYLWSETSLNYDNTTFEAVATQLETEIYPKLLALYGEPWNPGIDNDPHISILHLADGNQFDEIGFFNSINQFPRTLDDASNEQEIIFLNMSGLELETTLYYATLAHELHHLIHWNLDANETVWLNEGIAQLTERYLGYQTSETLDYLDDTDTQLNFWDYEEFAVYRHYAVSYLFMTYVWEQFGEEAIRQIAASPQNGLSSVRAVLGEIASERTLEQLLSDWAVANLLDDTARDERYGYRFLTLGFPDKVARIRDLPFEKVKSISQYGVHYIDLRTEGTLTVSFAGDSSAEILPLAPTHDRFWFAPSESDLAATLTRPIDLTNVKAATLNFTTYFELEPDYDFAYVAVSVDDGRSWESILPFDSFASGLYGAAMTGFSSDQEGNDNGWVDGSVALNDYAGQEILLRFEVLSDGAFSERGFALAEISIPEIGLVSTSADPTWTRNGFVEIGIMIPQQWSVQLVQGHEVMTLELDDFNRGRWVVTIEDSAEPTTLIIMPQTPYINDPAFYWLHIAE